MIDRTAFSFVPKDLVGLFRRLNGACMADILDTLDALLKEKNFYPNFNTYRAQLDSAGIFVARMEVAMSAVLSKNASSLTNTTWEEFQRVQGFKLKLLPADQQGTIQSYWSAGPNPGLQAGSVPVNPAVAKVGWDKYVDQFTECIYDVNYQVKNYFSTVLRLKYADGVSIDLDIETDFSDVTVSATAARDSMAVGKLGAGGRIFPSSLNSRTTPRLYAARAEAFRIQDEEFRNFANLAVTGVAFALSVPAMPAGPLSEGLAGSNLRVARRQISGTARAAGIPSAELQAINAIRAANPQFSSLTNEELVAIRAYTREDWAAINLSLRDASGGGSPGGMAKSVISGLNKLPGYNGKLVRSESWAIDQAVARYAEGKPFVPEGLLSTSNAGAVAQREGNIALTIKAIGKQGKDISKISAKAGQESEILFPPGSKFIVEKAVRVGDALIVTLREL